MYGVSPMHLAAENGHLLCLRVLFDAGAACNVGSAEKRPQWVTTSGIHQFLSYCSCMDLQGSGHCGVALGKLITLTT